MIAVIKNFQEVIETKDISRMSKELYEFLILHCGFIAHYDIHGFKGRSEDVAQAGVLAYLRVECFRMSGLQDQDFHALKILRFLTRL